MDDCSPEAQSASTPQIGGDAENRFELQLSLNRIPYTIVGRCAGAAQNFCQSRAAQCSLIGQLILLGGTPQ
jgi:hypothetical protein